MKKSDDEWVHDTYNFAWHHHHVNIYEAMSVDILHQLNKGVVKNLIDWVTELISEGLPSKSTKKGKIKDSLGLI